LTGADDVETVQVRLPPDGFIAPAVLEASVGDDVDAQGNAYELKATLRGKRSATPV
jgi:hypothetical protein